jgi:ectoine hydroxylase-related dioxygenase (phytanoyl-CoA dioxygenase family)
LHRLGQPADTLFSLGSSTFRPGCINCLFFLSPFTPQNGGTFLLPRSHQRRQRAKAADGFADLGFPDKELGNGLIRPHPDTVHAAGAAGSVCLFDCRLWHCAAPNQSSESRVMINVRYVPSSDGYKPRDTIDRATFRELPAVAKQLYQASLANE